MTHEEKVALVESRNWYQRFEILPDVFTNGRANVNARWFLDRCGLPEDLSGLRCLDIGTREGAYAFELERRGASVVATGTEDPGESGFNTAKAVCESAVEYKQVQVYDLSRESLGSFDIALFFAAFCHLKHPALGFERIGGVLHAGGTVVFEGAILDHADRLDPTFRPLVKNLKKVMNMPLLYYVADSYLDDPTIWNLPNQACLEDWVRSSGFDRVTCQKNEEASRCYGTAKRLS